MKAFQVKDFEMTAKRPSLNSVIAQKKRLAQQQEEQDALLQEDTYTETEQKLMDEAGSMSLIDHLGELRGRIIVALVAMIVGTIVSYYYVEDIIQILIAPAGKLYYTKPTEAFFYIHEDFHCLWLNRVESSLVLPDLGFHYSRLVKR